MRLDEAEKILNDNGYELLEEGKIGKALTVGALAIGSIFGTANADYKSNISNLKKIEKYEEIDCNDVYLNRNSKEQIDNLYHYTCYEGENGQEFLVSNEKEPYKEIIVTDINTGNIEQRVFLFDNESIVNSYYDNLLSSKQINYKNGTTESAWVLNDNIVYKKIDKNGNGIFYDILSNGDSNEYLSNLNFDAIEEEHIVEEGKLKNGYRNGKFYIYDEDGSIAQIDQYVNGKKNGTSIGYFADGTEAFRVQYKNGKQIGHMVCSDGRKGRNLTCYNPKYNED